MADLLNGTQVPWDFLISTQRELGPSSARERGAGRYERPALPSSPRPATAQTELPPPPVWEPEPEPEPEPQPTRHLVAGGLYALAAVAAHWLKGRS